VGDAVLMLQYATYSVISPEGCASILWRSADQAPEAADVLGITAGRLKTLGLIDKIVPEPLGGAHRDPQATAQALRKRSPRRSSSCRRKSPKSCRATPRARNGLWQVQGNRRAVSSSPRSAISRFHRSARQAPRSRLSAGSIL